MKCLANAGPGDDRGLHNEERGLLFTIHVQFVLFNLNLMLHAKPNAIEIQATVSAYLKNLFKVCQEVLEHGRMAVKSNKKAIVELFHEESAILAILHLTFVALLSAPYKFCYNLMDDLVSLSKAGIALQKIVPMSEINDWVFLIDLNGLASALLSKILNFVINKNQEDSNIERQLNSNLQPFSDSPLVRNAALANDQEVKNPGNFNL